MADNFSDIMGNYKNMSVEELGSSLLQRQSDQAAAARKRSKKQDRVQQALALMLTGQAIFKGAYKNRMEELNASQAWEKENQKAQALQMRRLSALVPTIPEEWHPDKSAAERADLLINDSKYREEVLAKTGVYYEKDLNAYGITKEMPSYHKIRESMAKTFMENLFEKGDNGIENYKNYESALAGFFGEQDYDRLELFQKGMNLEEHNITKYEADSYARLQRQYKDESGFINGTKAFFKSLGNRAESEGKPNLFRNITNQELANPKLSQVLETLNLRGISNVAIHKAIAQTRAAPKRYSEEIRKEENGAILEDLKETFNSMSSEVRRSEGKIKSTLGKQGHWVNTLDQDDLLKIGVDTWGRDYESAKADPSVIIIEEDFKAFQKYIEANTDIGTQFFDDVGALVLRLEGDPSVGVDLYEMYSVDENGKYSQPEMDKFKNAMGDPEFLYQFAIAITAKENFTPDHTVFWNGPEEGYKDNGLQNQDYEATSAFNVLVGNSKFNVVKDSNGKQKFKANKEYAKSNVQSKRVVYDQTIRQILEAPVDKLSDQEKQQVLDSLFDSIPNPRGMGQLDYLDAMKKNRESLNELIMTGGQGGIGMMIPRPMPTPVADYLKKKESTDPEQYTQQLTDSRVESLSRPYTPDEHSEQVVSDAIDIAVSISTRPPEIIKRRGKLLKAIASYESNFGTSEYTFNNPLKDKSGDSAFGYTQMKDIALEDVTRMFDPETADGNGPFIRKYNEMIIERLGSEYDLSKMTREDMRKPLHHALMASAYLSRVEPAIPVNEELWGKYYMDHWNKYDGYASAEKFLAHNGYYLKATKDTIKSLLNRD